MSWILVHPVAAAIFLLAILGLAVGLGRLPQEKRSLLPWLFLGAWLVAGLTQYVSWQVGRFFLYDKSMWAAQTITLGVVTLLPLLLVLLAFLLPTLAQRSSAVRTGIAIGLGLVGFLLVPTASGMMGELLRPAERVATPE